MDGNVHKPATCCPGEASISDTTGLEASTRAYCHSDHGPASPSAVDARTRQRISQPSLSSPDATLGVCNQHLLVV
ncbi:hypothetical protein GCM10020216_047160 [Nonomuraea helvata]